MSPRRAFTLIELLAVVGVIAVLIALLAPAVGILRRKQGEARALRELEQLSAALSAYLGDRPMLGDPPASASAVPDFARRPLHYLVDQPLAAKREPYLRPVLARLAGDDGRPPAMPAGATRLLDPFLQPVRWAIVQDPVDKPRFTRAVAILSGRGTRDRADDVILAWRDEDGRWRRVAWSDLVAASAIDSGSRTREQRDLADLEAAFERERAALP